MILNINSNSKLDNYEFELCENLNQILYKIKGDTNKFWTIAVFEILSKNKKDNNKIACSKLESSLKDCGEWLFDYVEYSENEINFNNVIYSVLSDIHLIVECEWNFYKKENYFIDLKYDFEKLLVGKSNYRLFIFENDNLERAKEIINNLKIIALNFGKFEKEERILFAVWIKGKHFYFENYVK